MNTDDIELNVMFQTRRVRWVCHFAWHSLKTRSERNQATCVPSDTLTLPHAHCLPKNSISSRTPS